MTASVSATIRRTTPWLVAPSASRTAISLVRCETP